MNRKIGAAIRLAGLAAVALAACGSLAASPAVAKSLFTHGGAQPSARSSADAAGAATLAGQVAQAISEKRFVDAQSMLDQAVVTGVTSPELTILRGDLFLNRGHYNDALDTYRTVAAEPVWRARALQGEGLAFSLLNRSEEALAALKEATTLDKGLWMAWNGLGREYDLRRAWSSAKSAYAAALAAPGANTAIILNNRGYSEMLQTQVDAAATDFVAALEHDPALAAARTNLRIALAMEGHYARAAVTGVGDDRAAVLNNVGLAAAMRGDYLQADRLLNEAMAAKGQYYARAAENLQLSRSLAERQDDLSTAHDAAH